MLLFLLTLALAELVLIYGTVWLCVAGFRVRPWWALVVLVPFGPLIFASKHWREARAPFLTVVISGAIIGGTIAAQPELWAQVKQGRAHETLAKTQRSAPGTVPARAAHEVRDLAENEAPVVAPAVTADPNAAARAAYGKSFSDLDALYQQLARERATLKPGKATADFNAKAARYQDALKALARQKAQLDSLDHPTANLSQVRVAAAAGVVGGIPHSANPQDSNGLAAYDRLQLLASKEDYPAFAELLKKCLDSYRQTPVFPQMVALGRQTLGNATPARIAAAWQRQAEAARVEMQTVTQQIQAIVNQVPARVSAPPPGADVYNIDYHPGATKPDLDHANLASTRESQPGQYLYVKHVPGVYYRSADCEFNAQTKYFITNRDVPKKRLTDAEYATLTELYHTLGRDEKLAAGQSQQTAEVTRTADELLALNTQLAALPAK